MNSETVIDLRSYVDPLTQFVRTSVASFVEAHPDVPAATIGLWGDGFHGWIALHVDTPEHRDAFVAKWGEEETGSVARDDHGSFCVSCWDFPYDLGEWELQGWPNLYTLPLDDLSLLSMTGEALRIDPEAGNEPFHQALFPLMTTVMGRLGDFPTLRRVPPFRAGAAIHDANLSAFRTIDV